MPIKTLRDKDVAQSNPELGRFYKGAPKPEGKKGSGREMPDLRFESHEDFPEQRDIVYGHFGAEIMELGPVFINGKNPDEAFPHFFEDWRGKLLITRCDGEEIWKQWVSDGQGTKGEHQYERSPCRRDSEKGCNCRQKGRLSFSIPAIEAVTGRLGNYVLGVGGWKDIQQIWSQLNHIYMRYCIPMSIPLNRVPFVIRRVQDTINRNEGGKRTQRKGWMAYLYPTDSFVMQAAEFDLKNPVAENGDTPIENTAFADDGIASRLAPLIEKHVPELTLAKWCTAMNITPDQLEEYYSDWDMTRLELTKWIDQNDMELLAYSMVGVPQQNGQWWYSFDVGIAQVWAFSRKLFTEAEYDTEGWQTTDVIQFDEPMVVRIQKARDKDYFTIIEVL